MIRPRATSASAVGRGARVGSARPGSPGCAGAPLPASPFPRLQPNAGARPGRRSARSGPHSRRSRWRRGAASSCSLAGRAPFHAMFNSFRSCSGAGSRRAGPIIQIGTVGIWCQSVLTSQRRTDGPNRSPATGAQTKAPVTGPPFRAPHAARRPRYSRPAGPSACSRSRHVRQAALVGRRCTLADLLQISRGGSARWRCRQMNTTRPSSRNFRKKSSMKPM